MKSPLFLTLVAYHSSSFMHHMNFLLLKIRKRYVFLSFVSITVVGIKSKGALLDFRACLSSNLISQYKNKIAV